MYSKIRGKLSKDHNILKRIIFEQHEIIKDRDIVSRNPGFDENTNLILAGLRRAGKTTMLYQLVCKLVEKGVEDIGGQEVNDLQDKPGGLDVSVLPIGSVSGLPVAPHPYG